MRNQYKLLAEKYSDIQENDKEDILAGLEELGKMPPVVYEISTDMCRGEYDRTTMSEWTPEQIRENFFEDENAVNYYADFTDDLPEYNFEAFINLIKQGEVITINGEETSYSFCREPVTLKNYIDTWEQENGIEHVED